MKWPGIDNTKKMRKASLLEGKKIYMYTYIYIHAHTHANTHTHSIYISPKIINDRKFKSKIWQRIWLWNLQKIHQNYIIKRNSSFWKEKKLKHNTIRFMWGEICVLCFTTNSLTHNVKSNIWHFVMHVCAHVCM